MLPMVVNAVSKGQGSSGVRVEWFEPNRTSKQYIIHNINNIHIFIREELKGRQKREVISMQFSIVKIFFILTNILICTEYIFLYDIKYIRLSCTFVYLFSSVF